jgi:hypothetical protein
MKTSILSIISVLCTTVQAQNEGIGTCSPQRDLERLKAENASLKKRLEQIESKPGRQ